MSSLNCFRTKLSIFDEIQTFPNHYPLVLTIAFIHYLSFEGVFEPFLSCLVAKPAFQLHLFRVDLT